MSKSFLAASLAGLFVSAAFHPAFATWPTDPSVSVPLCTAATYQSRPAITTDGAGGAIVTWQDGRLGGVYAQHVTATGAVDPFWPLDGRALTSIVPYGFVPKAISDGSGGAIVTWYDERGVDFSNHVYAQHVLVSGAIDPSWPQDGLALCTQPSDSPTIVGDGSGGAIVTWSDGRNSLNADIYAQHILPSGAVDPAWPIDGQALCTNPKHQFFPLLVSDG